MSDVIRDLKDSAAQLMAKGKLPAALDAWKKVVDKAPDDVAARQKVGDLLVKLGKKGEAVEAYVEAARRYAEGGMFFKASALCKLVLQLDPGHQQTQGFIASLYAKSEKPLPSKPGVGLPVAPPVAAAQPPPPPLSSLAPEAPAEEIDIEIEVIAPPTASGLPSIPLFSMLAEAELKEVLGAAMEVRSIGAGEVIVAEGAPGDSMFALVEGTVGVFRAFGREEQRRVATMNAGEIFGEVALVSGGQRVAHVVADDDGAVVLEFSKAAMDQVFSKFPRVAEVLAEFYRERLMLNLLRANPVLRALGPTVKKQLVAAFDPEHFAAGATIVTEGEPTNAVYAVLRGSCGVKHSSGSSYPDLREGDLFGEISVLTDGPATATVIANGPTLTLAIPAETFKQLVLSDPSAAMSVKLVARQRLDRTARFDRVYGLDSGAEDKRV